MFKVIFWNIIQLLNEGIVDFKKLFYQLLNLKENKFHHNQNITEILNKNEILLLLSTEFKQLTCMAF